MDLWDAQVGQELLLKYEPNNNEDSYAVAVLNEDVIVGHVPYNLAPVVEMFMRREVNTGFAEIANWQQGELRSWLWSRNSKNIL